MAVAKERRRKFFIFQNIKKQNEYSELRDWSLGKQTAGENTFTMPNSSEFWKYLSGCLLSPAEHVHELVRFQIIRTLTCMQELIFHKQRSTSCSLPESLFSQSHSHLNSQMSDLLFKELEFSPSHKGTSAKIDRSMSSCCKSETVLKQRNRNSTHKTSVNCTLVKQTEEGRLDRLRFVCTYVPSAGTGVQSSSIDNESKGEVRRDHSQGQDCR